MGADKGIHIVTESRTDQEIQPLAVAKIIAQLATREKVDAVIVGKQAIDGDNCQTGAMIAGVLGWSQCTMASKVEVQAGKVFVAQYIVIVINLCILCYYYFSLKIF